MLCLYLPPLPSPSPPISLPSHLPPLLSPSPPIFLPSRLPPLPSPSPPISLSFHLPPLSYLHLSVIFLSAFPLPSLSSPPLHSFPSHPPSPLFPPILSPLSSPLPRWLCFCHVPGQCESFPKYEMTNVFGRTLLLSVSGVMRHHLMDKFMADQDRMPPEKKNLTLNILPQ